MTPLSPRVLVPPSLKPDFTTLTGEVQGLTGRCMGTTWQVRILCDPDATKHLAECIPARLESIEAQMSHFRPDSPLRQFARLPAGTSMALPDDFARVMQAALAVAEESRGKFDPTLAEVVDAWGFGAGRRYTDPAFRLPQPLNPRIRHAWKQLRIDANNHMSQPGGIALNLAAIAKGYAVDAIAEDLRRQGFHNFLVEVGGELRGEGMKPDQQPWWVALEAPTPDCPLAPTRLALHAGAVATSGNYRQRYRAGERLLQHTIDPGTCAPVHHALASVTVLHESCMLADAWATAIMAAGPEEGLALAENRQLAALLQWRTPQGSWQEAMSPRLRAYLH